MIRERSLAALLLGAALLGCTEEPPAQKAPRFVVGAADASERIEAAARDHLARGTLLDDVDLLVARHPSVDVRGTAHARLEQRHGGVPVLGGEIIVHVPPDGGQILVTDHLLHALDVDVDPALDEREAIAITREHAQRPEATADDVQLVIVREQGVDHLVWQVALRDMVLPDPALPMAWVDAHTGAIVFAWDNLQTGRDRETFDAANSQSWPPTPARTELQGPTLDIPVDKAHDYTGVTWDYYDQLHGRDSYDDAGHTVTSVVDLGPNYNNAYWDGSILAYGDGSSGPSFCESLDVVAHEFTHAVTSHTARLVYNQESGGLNEATSDIMSAVVESWNTGSWQVTETETWRVGDQLGGGFRSMSNPPQYGDLDSYLNYNSGLDVHVTSGIANKAFFLWVDGGALTIEEAGEVWYHALTNYMTPRTSFADARTATQQATFDLFGPGSKVAAVANGWGAVDVPGTPAYEIFDQVGPISLTSGQSQLYTFTTDPTATAARFLLVGGDGNADLYVNEGTTPPTNQVADCAAATPRSREVCSFDPVVPGDYTVLVEAASTFSDARLFAWQAVPGGVVCSDDDGDGVTTCQGDCDDTTGAIFPGAVEVCNGADDDCDGVVDGPASTDALTFYADADGDGFGDPGVTQLECTVPAGHVANADDCDDTNDKVHPGAQEVCNSADDDCDGTVDGASAIGAVDWYADADGDGFGDPAQVTVDCLGPVGTVRNADDCDDASNAVFPGATELCNGVDDDCDTAIDPSTSQDALEWYPDADGDGFGVNGPTQLACTQPVGFAPGIGDCDDQAATVYPGAPEYCNGIDDDCNNLVDPPSSVDAPQWYVDGDGDGYGDPASSPRSSCSPLNGRIDNADDCDDTRGDVSPGAPEVCDPLDVDENCDGTAEEPGAQGAMTYWLDLDGDGFGDPTTEATECDWPADAIPAAVLGDCDDTEPSINPYSREICDGVDQDCDDLVDDDAIDFQVFYVDADGDGFGGEPVEACDQPDGTVLVDGDCDDGDASVNPDADEIANDDIDQDCDGADLVEAIPGDTGGPGNPDPGDPDPNDPGDPKGSGDREPGGCSTSGSLPGSAAWVLVGLLGLLQRRR